MLRRVLVAFASKHGSTREVAQAVAADLRAAGLDVDLLEAKAVRSLDDYDAVVLGGAIYMGRWHKDAQTLLRRHSAALADLPLYMFGMGPQDLEAEHVAESRAQVERGLRSAAAEVRPQSIVIFGGVVDPAKLAFPLNRMPAVDARDWDAVHGWAQDVATAVGTAAAVD
jgi:menaquinone-dependent protoporphyrinogen oxidase